MSSGAARLGARRARSRWFFIALAALSLAGCGILPRNAVPIEKMGAAVIPGMPDVRATAGRLDPAMVDDLARSFAQESREDFPAGPDGRVRYSQLALSGGGPNGAYGAGFVNGWTRTGKRPKFKIVTGVSTGALMAPFALLGPKYDDALREFYTTTASRNIFRMLSILPQLLGGESLAETGPLQAMIAQYVDAAFLREIAQAHARGQRLYVGTVDLDAQNFVVWNMGLIATHGNDQALELFRSVMLASASIPVAFPPVFFEVEAEGRRYDEMHVDGSVVTRVFYTGGVFSFASARDRAGGDPWVADVYVIHNGQLLPVAETTQRTLRGIAARVFDTTGKAAVIGDLFRINAVVTREQSRFHWVTIPEDFPLGGNEVFDPVAMGNLYDLGYRNALAGPDWRTAPPGMSALYPPP
ncbi:MAG: patatin-like phospholipase family protein [Burkholderiales bacterium]